MQSSLSEFVVEQVDFIISSVIPEGFVDGYPVSESRLDLLLDPVLDACELCNVLEHFEIVHVEEVIPDVVDLFDVSSEGHSLALQLCTVRPAHEALVPLLLLHLLFRMPLLCKLVNYYRGNYVREEDLKEAPMY